VNRSNVPVDLVLWHLIDETEEGAPVRAFGIAERERAAPLAAKPKACAAIAADWHDKASSKYEAN
jgi:hypothetical protein